MPKLTHFVTLPEECLFEIMSFFELNPSTTTESHNKLYTQLQLVCKEWSEVFTSNMFYFVFKEWPNKNPLSINGLKCPYSSSLFSQMDMSPLRVLNLTNAESLDFSVAIHLEFLKLDNMQSFTNPLLLPDNLLQLCLIFPHETDIDLSTTKFTCPKSLVEFEFDYQRRNPSGKICILEGIELNQDLEKLKFQCDFYRLNIYSVSMLKELVIEQRYKGFDCQPLCPLPSLTHLTKLTTIHSCCASARHLHRLGILPYVTQLVIYTHKFHFDTSSFPSLHTICINICSPHADEATKYNLIEKGQKCLEETNIQRINFYMNCKIFHCLNKEKS